ncbi:MAG: hypothetical protein ABI999_11435 [Acidobacteriota bacterium]
MKVKQPITITLMLLAACLATACNPKPENKTVRYQRAANSPMPGNGTEIGETPQSIESKNAGGSLATPSEAYKTAFAARKNKNIAEIKRVLSKDMLEFFTMIGDGEKKSLDDELRQLAEAPQGPSDDTRNERIAQDTATVEYLDENGKWKQMDIVKEGNDWKLTIPKGKNRH